MHHDSPDARVPHTEHGERRNCRTFRTLRVTDDSLSTPRIKEAMSSVGRGGKGGGRQMV